MAVRRAVMCGCVMGMCVWISGCASLEELRQAQMANRNLAAEKAQLEQDVYDLRAAVESVRGRSDSLQQQLANKDQLITNLEGENNRLEGYAQTATGLVERYADQPLGQPVITTSRLPAELDLALREFATQHSGSVSYEADQGTVKWTSDLLFAFASDVVRDTARSSLDGFAEIMRSPAAANFDVVVVGHTDDIPISNPGTKAKHPTNRHLSVHRAVAVGQKLESAGLNGARIGVMGYGEYRPVVANDSDANRGRNRRVEMYIVPSGSFAAGTELAAFTGHPPQGSIK